MTEGVLIEFLFMEIFMRGTQVRSLNTIRYLRAAYYFISYFDRILAEILSFLKNLSLKDSFWQHRLAP